MMIDISSPARSAISFEDKDSSWSMTEYWLGAASRLIHTWHYIGRNGKLKVTVMSYGESREHRSQNLVECTRSPICLGTNQNLQIVAIAHCSILNQTKATQTSEQAVSISMYAQSQIGSCVDAECGA